VIGRVGIVAKQGLTAAAPHLDNVVRWLAKRGIEPVLETATAALIGAPPALVTAGRDELPSQVDLVIVLGGDGTLLSIADRVGDAGRETPILGINFGRLGFLTEVTLPEMLPALESVLQGTAVVVQRAMLRVQNRRGDHVVEDRILLNDVVVNRGALSRLIYLAVHVDDLFVTNVRADGLIIASPTGSTAYNLAAGGPIVHAGVDALLLTPIAPHSLGNRPIVVPGASSIRVCPAAHSGEEMFITYDGQRGAPFEPNDELMVTRAERVLRTIASPTRGYYDTLREKLRWGER
jgi:NAD+ kinase